LKTEDNPKLEELKSLLEQTDDDVKVLIFSFYKCSISAISEFLKENKYKYLSIQGDDGQDAFEVIKAFKEGDYKCLCSTDVVNFGHNVQAASMVINFEQPLKPSTHQQRVGRCYRTGQQRDVHAYTFVTNNTVEEVINGHYEAKKHIITEMIEKMDQKGLEDYQKELNKKILQSLE
jgi:SNF2 family DNA or RNA helicase